MSRLIFHIDVNSAFLSWESARRVKEGLPDPDRRTDGNGTSEMPGARDRTERF